MSALTDLAVGTSADDRVAAATDLITTAFHSLAVSKWLVADPDQRWAAQHAQFQMLVEHAAEHGTIYLDPDRTATAVWLDYTRPVPEPADYDRRLLQACGEHVARFAALDVAFAEHHPSAPHQHLAFMAVHPRQQQRGRGSALLADHHRRLDAAGVPAYLEAANLRAARLYGRWGYRILDRIDLPGGPSMWPMWREPGAQA